MPIILIPDDYEQSGPFSEECHVQDKPKESKLLGPDGKPLKYEKQKIGFDLSRKRTRT